MACTHNSTALFWLALCLFVAVTQVESLSSLRRKLRRPYEWGNCTSENFLCRNKNCIQRNLFCNGRNDCGDNSDEEYCRYTGRFYGCPGHYSFFQCNYKCIPSVWKCDGINDCSNGEDEKNCVSGVQVNGVNDAAQKAQKWLEVQSRRNSTIDKWGVHVPRIGVALYFASTQYFIPDKPTGAEVTYEISLRLLRTIMRQNNKVERLSPNKLAVYMNALLVSCMNPKNFYGMNLVARLRHQIDLQVDYSNPFLYLVLCKAGGNMTQQDVDKLLSVSNTPLHGAWTEMRAFTLMALSCIAESGNVKPFPLANLTSLANELKQKQKEHGDFGTLQSTALVMQALMASGEDETKGWNLTEAVKSLLQSQKTDGSFGNLLNTYYVLPVLSDKSFLDINSSHCKNYYYEKPHEIQDDLDGGATDRVQVKYSIGFGDNLSILYTISLYVPSKSTVFDVMKIASDLNSNYRFLYITENSKPFIYEVNGIQNDPEYGKFWFLHVRDKTTGAAVPIKSSPVDVTVKDKQEYIMWYSGPHDLLEQGKSTEKTTTPTTVAYTMKF